MWLENPSAPSTDTGPEAVASRSPLGRTPVALLVLFAVLSTIGEPGLAPTRPEPSGVTAVRPDHTRSTSRSAPARLRIPVPVDPAVDSPEALAASEVAPAEPPTRVETPGETAVPVAVPPSPTPTTLPSTAPAPARPNVSRETSRSRDGRASRPEVEIPKSREWLRPLLARHARQAGIAPELLMALAWRESSWRTGARSSKGAIGVMQLMPDTVEFTSRRLLGRSRSLDPRHAESNIRMGARFLAHLLDRFDGDARLALAAYHQGTTSVLRNGPLGVSRRFASSVLALQASFAS